MPSDEPGSISGDKKFARAQRTAPLTLQRVSRRRTFREYRVPIAVDPSSQLAITRCCCLRAFAQHEHASADRLLRASAAPARSATRRLFTYTPPDCTSRRASLFDGASCTRATRSTTTHAVAVEFARRDISVDGTSSNTASTSSTRAACAMSSPNSTLRRVLGARDLLGAVHERRHLAREHALRLALLRRRLASPPRARSIARAIEEREELQIAHDVAIVGVQPELIEL